MKQENLKIDNKLNYSITIITLSLIILLGISFSWIEFPQESATPSVPSVSLSDELVSFKISGGEEYPEFKEISFDPFEAKGGEIQKLIVALQDEQQIISVYAEVEDETGKRNLEFIMFKKEDTITYWQGEWDIKLTKEKDYPITFFAESENGEANQITLFWKAKEGEAIEQQGLIEILKYGFKELKARWGILEVYADFINEFDCDSANDFPHAGNANLVDNLFLSASVTGIDGGSLLIDSSKTLQLAPETVFVFNEGQSLTPSGTIALGEDTGGNKARIVKGYLWMKDADSDDCGLSANDVAWTDTVVSPGGGVPGDIWRRVKDISYYPDPNDLDAGSAPGCVSPCECSSGACCSDGCNYDGTSDVCSTGTDYDYQCSGTGCGDDAQRKSRSITQYCSGSSSSCTGSTSYGSWSGWSNIDDCTATEKCSSDNSSYASCNYAPSCDCECSSGACCDGCNYRSSSYVCNSSYSTDYECRYGTDCGDDVWRRTKKQYCSGSSSSCTGSVSSWIWDSSAYDNCASTETCANNDSSCNYTPSCVTPTTFRVRLLCTDGNCNQKCVENSATCKSVELYSGWTTYFCDTCVECGPGCWQCQVGLGANCSTDFSCDSGYQTCEGAHPNYSWCLCEN